MKSLVQELSQISVVQAVNGGEEGTTKNYSALILATLAGKEDGSSRGGGRVREQCFILSKNEAVDYSFISIKNYF